MVRYRLPLITRSLILSVTLIMSPMVPAVLGARRLSGLRCRTHSDSAAIMPSWLSASSANRKLIGSSGSQARLPNNWLDPNRGEWKMTKEAREAIEDVVKD